MTTSPFGEANPYVTDTPLAPEPVAQRSRKPLIIGGAAVATIALAGAGAFFLLGSAEEEAPPVVTANAQGQPAPAATEEAPAAAPVLTTFSARNPFMQPGKVAAAGSGGGGSTATGGTSTYTGGSTTGSTSTTGTSALTKAIPGPAGATGPAGPAGPAGVNGKDGKNGSDGQQGKNGDSVAAVQVTFTSFKVNDNGTPADTTDDVVTDAQFSTTTISAAGAGAPAPQSKPLPVVGESVFGTTAPLNQVFLTGAVGDTTAADVTDDAVTVKVYGQTVTLKPGESSTFYIIVPGA